MVMVKLKLIKFTSPNPKMARVKGSANRNPRRLPRSRAPRKTAPVFCTVKQARKMLASSELASCGDQSPFRILVPDTSDDETVAATDDEVLISEAPLEAPPVRSSSDDTFMSQLDACMVNVTRFHRMVASAPSEGCFYVDIIVEDTVVRSQCQSLDKILHIAAQALYAHAKAEPAVYHDPKHPVTDIVFLLNLFFVLVVLGCQSC